MIKRLILILAATSAILSCRKPFNPADFSDSLIYQGSVFVEYQGENFENKDIIVTFTLSEDESSADIQINQIRFVPMMPVTVDTVLPVSVSGSDGSYTFSADDVYPHSPAGAEQNKYKINKLSGMVTGSMLSFSLFFGDYPTSFIGQRQETSTQN